MTKIKLELLTDGDMVLMFEEGTRGGVSTAIIRCAKANNKYMKNYNSEEESKFIVDLDANNQYGWAMSEPLPVRGFKWMTKPQLENWREYPCILEVDLEYLESLHDLHNEYPLVPQNILLNGVTNSKLVKLKTILITWN